MAPELALSYTFSWLLLSPLQISQSWLSCAVFIDMYMSELPSTALYAAAKTWSVIATVLSVRDIYVCNTYIYWFMYILQPQHILSAFLSLSD